jgi:hydrogenase nickel incorporation protein HypA/HybF
LDAGSPCRLEGGANAADRLGTARLRFQRASKGTVSEDAELSIIELPVVLKCNACGERTAGESMVFVCQNCGSTDVDLLSGMELTIESLEVETRVN